MTTEVGIGVVQPSGHKSRNSYGLLKLKEQKNLIDSPLEIPEVVPPCRHFDFGLLNSRAGREEMSAVLSHRVCGNFLWQPQEANVTHMEEIFKIPEAHT